MNKLNSKQNASKKIRKGDTVIAIAGNNRGQTGTVMAVQGERVVVQGLNVRKKAVKKSQAQPEGGFIDREMSIHVSNLKVCVNDKPVKLKVKQSNDGTKGLYYSDNGQDVLYRAIKKS